MPEESDSQPAPLAHDEVLAERIYSLDRGGVPKIIRIQIGFPRFRSTDKRYECLAVPQGDESVVRRPMNGIDAIEAIQLALEILRVDLHHILSCSEGDVSWAKLPQPRRLPPDPQG